MKHISLSTHEHMAVVGLNRGRSNAINADVLRELTVVLQSIENDDTIAGMILHGKEGFFSAGLDLIELYEYNEADIKLFWENFLGFIKTFVAFKKPTVAAIEGHCPAAGCILALCCDYRIMAKGEYIIGLNEIPIGIIVPESIFLLYSFWLGKANAYRCLLEGKLLSPEDALSIGLIDELVEASALRRKTEQQLKTFITLDANTWQQSKLNFRRELISQTEDLPSATLKTVLEQWWSPSTRSILKTIINNLQGKKH